MALTDDQIARWLDLTGVYMNSPHAFYIMPDDARDLNAALVELRDLRNALRQYADAENWGYYDGSGCPKGVGDVEEACFIGPDVAREALGLVIDTDASADG